MEVIALHGFLGLAEDWAPFDVRGVDLWPQVADFETWTRAFADQVTGRPLLLGYSMGARLALHAALAAPERFSGAIFVSANPGLATPEARAVRLASDLRWAERFRHDDWDLLMRDWNAQPVLRGTSLTRPEAAFDRERLARAMDLWSLGRQANLRPGIAQLQLPHLFLTGSEDAKFTTLHRELRLNPAGRHMVVEGAGHRLPWDQPERFRELVRGFSS